MSLRGVYAREAWHELQTGLRSSLVPLMFAGLVGYLFIMLTSADTLRDMGGADVARNSPLLVFLMTSGQSFWLIFAWAWVFSQVVTRDRQANLQELVLCAPVSLRGLLFARFAGAAALAILLGSSSALGFGLVPALAALHVLPPEAIGPTPHLAILWAWLLFVPPSAIGLGALYLCAALKTRSSVGAFATSAVVILIWMVAMIALRGGSMHPDLATLMDVTGFGEAELQTKRWTPHEKSTALLEVTQALLLNRLAWLLVPLALLFFVTNRLTREALVQERPRRPSPRPSAPRRSAPRLAPAGAEKPSWGAATAYEAAWHLTRTLRGWPFWVAAALWTLLNVAGAFYHVVGHADGPLVPRAELIAPVHVQLSYLFSVFAVAGFVGALLRRDHLRGVDELLDTTTAPLGVRALGQALAAFALTLILALLPSLSAWIVEALATTGFDPWTALLVNGLGVAPALLEIAALSFFAHALVRSPGTAYALSMLVAFIAIVNHEAGIVAYPPGQVGVPIHVTPSALTGWLPWLPQVFELAALKLAVAVLAVGLAWLALPRGTDSSARRRFAEALARARGAAGLVTALAALAVVLGAWRLHERIVVRGGFQTKTEAEAADAAWEARFAREPAVFTVEGGEVRARLDVTRARAEVTWELRGLHASPPVLQGALRPGMQLVGARVEGRARALVQEHDAFSVELGECAASRAGCALELAVRVDAPSWFDDEQEPWLGAGAWVRASDLLPRLGYDPERALRSPSVRKSLGLPARRSAAAAGALTPALAVAPRGDWRWSVAFTQAGSGSPARGSTEGPLDFAVTWAPAGGPLEELRVGSLTAFHDARHRDTAREILEDLGAMQACVGARLPDPRGASVLIQAPRGLGAAARHGSALWLPEDAGWDVGPGGAGRVRRRAVLATALARESLAARADLRAEPGFRWLSDGVAGWVGLECVRESDGEARFVRLLARRTEALADAFGALDTPLTGLAEDGGMEWVREYAPQATLAWAQSVGRDEALRITLGVADGIRAGRSLRSALAEGAGEQVASALLGKPSAADVSIVARPGRPLEARGARFRWEGAGWQPATTTFDVTQRFAGDARRTQRVRLPAHLDGAAPFVVFDRAPSYERSPLDNHWAPETSK